MREHTTTTLIFNRGSRRLIFGYFVLVALVYAGVFLSDIQLELLPTQELIKHVDWYAIFIQNTSSAFLIILLGLLSFGTVSSAVALYNLYLLSLAVYIAYLHSGSMTYTLLVILTHGIVEIIAIVLSYYLSTISLRLLINKLYQKQIFYIQSLRQFMWYLLFIVGLFLLAALLEAYLTPTVVSLILE
ncbi:stage II sporulation protein M (plasmid) [Pseudalkalibacillus hwajinpoensis]|uniref:stage II sporulation protein M n=1 Tax=Guptibacillus hwajinpoensis TaxID=208199 RepID=UPI00325B396E